MNRSFSPALATLVAGMLAASPGAAQESAADLAKQLSNPVAALVSVPFQLNHDRDIGPAEGGSRWSLNVQPVVPVGLNARWNLISRTIVPLVSQDEVFPGAGRQSGLGDVVQSFFVSPSSPSAGGWIWGVGPAFAVPTATEDLLGSGRWSAGPTAVALRQQGGWTVGALANHLWSFAGDGDRAHVNASFVQPFVSYTTPDAWTFTLNTESTYDWREDRWTVPVNALASRITRVGDQLLSIGGGLRWWADGPQGAPSGIGFRLVVTLLFPR